MYRFMFLILVVLASQTLGKDCDQKFHGCKIDYSRRECLDGEAVGCESPFPYNTMEECQQDFRGNGNICDKSSPCGHGGLCLPVKWMDRNHRPERGYKCDCHGTGYYGKHCEIKCTKNLPKENMLAEACIF